MLSSDKVATIDGHEQIQIARLYAAQRFATNGFDMTCQVWRIDGLTLTELILPRGLERIAALTAALPLARAASPAEAAQAYIYLMVNGYITGQILPVDGGGLLV